MSVCSFSGEEVTGAASLTNPASHKACRSALNSTFRYSGVSLRPRPISTVSGSISAWFKKTLIEYAVRRREAPQQRIRRRFERLISIKLSFSGHCRTGQSSRRGTPPKHGDRTEPRCLATPINRIPMIAPLQCPRKTHMCLPGSAAKTSPRGPFAAAPAYHFKQARSGSLPLCERKGRENCQSVSRRAFKAWTVDDNCSRMLSNEVLPFKARYYFIRKNIPASYHDEAIRNRAPQHRVARPPSAATHVRS